MIDFCDMNYLNVIWSYGEVRNSALSRGSAIDLIRGVRMSWISQNCAKVSHIFFIIWLQLKSSQKSRGQFDPLHHSNGAPVASSNTALIRPDAASTHPSRRNRSEGWNRYETFYFVYIIVLQVGYVLVCFG